MEERTHSDKDMKTSEYENALISIIVPCYNVERYLKRCIKSLIDQTYRNIEIILVDDGSTDRTGKICDEYAAKDSRIKVIHQENGGSSVARNTGMDVATGEYISFCDSDDWVDTDTYEYFISLLENYNAECAVGIMYGVNTFEDHLRVRREKRKQDYTVTSTEAMKTILLEGGGVNNRLFKRQGIEEIRFPVGKINEDEIVILKFYAKQKKKIVMGGRQTYYYRHRPNSVTSSGFSIKSLDWYNNTIKNVEFIRKERSELLEYAYARYYRAAIHCSAYLHFYRLGDEGRKFRKKIRTELRRYLIRILKSRYLPIKYKFVGMACCII